MKTHKAITFPFYMLSLSLLISHNLSNPQQTMASNSRPLMLKDFLLLEESGSCSSPAKLRRSRSRSAAEAAIAALQRLFPSPSKKKSSPSPTATTEKKIEEEFVQVRVKDILRWRSLRDLIDGLDYEEEGPPLDCFPASRNGRWRSGEAPSGPAREWEGEKRNVGGADPMRAGTGTAELRCSDYVGPAKDEHISNDGEEQHSPVSILDSPFRDDEDSSASLNQSLANVERTRQRLLESIKWLENLAGVNPMDSDEEDETDDLTEEPTTEAKAKSHHRCKDEKLEVQVAREAKANLGYKKKPETEECVREMEKEAQWGRFKEQTNQLGTELGLGMLDALLDEALFELVGRSN